MMPVKVSVEEISDKLNLEVLEPGTGSILFQTQEISRPGLQFTGFYEKFSHRRVQLIGAAEMQYLYSLAPDSLRERMDHFMGLGVPCVVCARGNMPPAALLESAKRKFVPVFRTNLVTDRASHVISHYIQEKLAPRVMLHGELMEIYGVGVLIRGESGMGKSETALDLIRSGHRIVADDVVEVQRMEDVLVGRAPELTKHIVDIRGIGLIDVRYLYGMGSILDEKEIDFVIDLETMDDYNKADRPEGGREYVEILGRQVPNVVLPISPGRRVAVLVEVAVRNFRLKNFGYDAGSEFTRRLR